MEKALQKRKSKKSRKEKKGQSAASRRATEPPQQRLSRGASRCGANAAAAPATAASKTLLSAATKVAAVTRLLAAVKQPNHMVVNILVGYVAELEKALQSWCLFFDKVANLLLTSIS